MITTLRITSVLAVCLALISVVFPAIFGIRTDKEAVDFLNTPGAVEEFNKAEDNNAQGSNDKDQVSPLVKQAQAFALYLNPPPKPKPVEPNSFEAPVISRPSRPPTVSAKFEVVGTSFYAARPDLSLALIDEPGKGFRWVRQSTSIGHLIIQEIKDGLVVVKDGDRTFELAVKRPPKISLLKGDSAAIKIDSKTISGAADAVAVPAHHEMTAEETEKKMQELMQQIASMSITIEEANRIDNLGQELSVQDQNQPDVKDLPPSRINKPRVIRKRGVRR